MTNLVSKRTRSKRVMDAIVSVLTLLLLLPVLTVIALIIKITSDGPAIFCQERRGQHGRKFKMYKFRTMHSNNDSAAHREYCQNLIAGNVKHCGAYKIMNDPRVTKIGHFLRKTSLDELPQFWNVLLGDMSLVGPRPPVEYEYNVYKTRDLRRLDAIPGITGLWQVSGRSLLSFEQMIDLDLRYIKERSLWMDVKILLATPRAVFSGKDAF